MSVPTFKVETHDADLQRRGLVRPTKLTMVLRHNGISSWTMEMDPTSPADTVLKEERAGIVVTKQGLTVPILAGPAWERDIVEEVQPNGAVKRTLVYAGYSDDIWLRYRLAYPDPAVAASTGTWAVEADVRNAAAETMMKGYVDDNAGPSALAARRAAPYDDLTVQADAAGGSTFQWSARLTPLDELVTAIAERSVADGSPLGWRVARTTTPGLQFQVFVPADVSDLVVFALARRNVARGRRNTRGPELTTAIVGGDGDGTARTFDETSETNDWGRLERFVDHRQSSTAAELVSAGDAAIQEDHPRDSVELTPSGTGAFTYPDDYGLGDSISVVFDGTTFVDVVREVTIVLETGKAPRISPALSPVDLDAVDQARLDARVRHLESGT